MSDKPQSPVARSPATQPPVTARRTLRAILAGDTCVTAGSVFDAISARLADGLGIEVAVMGGSVASLAVLGAPDLIVLTMSELVEQARRACRAAPINLVVDADHGYGNALSVMRTVAELQAAGVAGVTIEDTLLPRAYGPSGAAQLTSLDEGVGRMRAALKARGAGPMLVFGRTSAASITGVDDAIMRLRAYEAAGVDALFVPGLKSREDLDRIAEAVTLPLVLGGFGRPLDDLAYLASRRVRVRLWGHQPMQAAIHALHAAMKALHEGVKPESLAGLASDALMSQVTRAADYQADTRDFLGGA